MHLVRRRRGLAGLVSPLGAEHMALETPRGQRFGQVGQVLGRRGLIGPVILVDEQQAPDRCW